VTRWRGGQVGGGGVTVASRRLGSGGKTGTEGRRINPSNHFLFFAYSGCVGG